MQVCSCDKKNDGHFFMLVSLKSQGANLQVKIWYECVIVYVAICYLLQGPYRNTMLTYSICIHMCVDLSSRFYRNLTFRNCTKLRHNVIFT